MPVHYIYLFVAIVCEVIATTALKAANGFTVLVPSVIVVVGYAIAFYFLGLTLKWLPVGITYAIWAGLGIVLVAIASAVVYRQMPDFYGILGMTLIVAGVVIVNTLSKTNVH